MHVPSSGASTEDPGGPSEDRGGPGHRAGEGRCRTTGQLEIRVDGDGDLMADGEKKDLEKDSDQFVVMETARDFDIWQKISSRLAVRWEFCDVLRPFGPHLQWF